MIRFRKTIKKSRILNPLKDFQEDGITFEYRADPLTGRNTTVIRGLAKYICKFSDSDEALINSLVEKTRVNCPFCPESVKHKTPMFTPDFLSEGRIVAGDSVVIPNLLGHADKSVLVILTKEHYKRLREFTPEMLYHGFKGSAIYLQRLQEVEHRTAYPAIIFNYLPPAGSSIFHPHMQILVREIPFYLVERLLEKSKIYYERNNTSYWRDLIDKEKGGKRYLFENGNVTWLVPFAPLRGINEVQAIVRGKSNFLKLNDKEWRGIAEGISRILRFYDKMGYVSFNIILISGDMNKDLDYFDVTLRIISRPGIQTLSFTDAWALPYLLWDGEAAEEPEVLAEKIKSFTKENT